LIESKANTKFSLSGSNVWHTGSNMPFIIAGPCAAESIDQINELATLISSLNIKVFRAGIWKPRTRPNQFEGLGTAALSWLAEVQKTYGLEAIIEVANAKHVEEALEAGIARLWVGARTTVNPFSVQEIADALKGVDMPVLVKNPVNPDLSLWIGALERLNQAGITQLAACHRGFSGFSKIRFRNHPNWEIPLEFRRLHPEIPLFCDPSHIAGKRSLIPEVAQKALDLGYEGLMVEVHPLPEKALSDSAQQLSPNELIHLLEHLVFRNPSVDNLQVQEKLQQLRDEIDEIDRAFLELLAERMKVSRRIGSLKEENLISYYQYQRWNEILENRSFWAEMSGVDPEFIRKLFELIHLESINQQSEGL